MKELRLDFCEKCFQMTNHLNDECQKCKANANKTSRYEDEDTTYEAKNYRKHRTS